MKRLEQVLLFGFLLLSVALYILSTPTPPGMLLGRMLLGLLPLAPVVYHLIPNKASIPKALLREGWFHTCLLVAMLVITFLVTMSQLIRFNVPPAAMSASEMTLVIQVCGVIVLSAFAFVLGLRGSWYILQETVTHYGKPRQRVQVA